MSTSLRGNAPAGQRAGNAWIAVRGEEKARGPSGARGKAEAPCRERCLDLGLGKAGDECAAFQAFFQGPGRLVGGARLNDEKACGVEACF